MLTLTSIAVLVTLYTPGLELTERGGSSSRDRNVEIIEANRKVASNKPARSIYRCFVGE